MSFKKQIFAFALFDLVLILILWAYLLFPIRFEQTKVGELSSTFPRWKRAKYSSSPYWKGEVFYGFMGKLEVVWREGDVCDKVKPPSPVELKKTPYGTLFLSKAAHGYIAGFFFCGENKLYWIDMLSWSRLSRNLDVFRKVVENLKYKGKPVFPLKVKFKTGWPTVKNSFFLFALSSAGIIFLSALYLALFPIFGACPREKEDCYPASMIKFPGKRFSKSRPCCVCFTEGKIEVYTKGYSPLYFSLEEARRSGTVIYLPGAVLYLNSPPPSRYFPS